MPETDGGPDVDVGDRVTYFDEDGEVCDAVVFNTYEYDDMIDLAYNAAGDGLFERVSNARYDQQLEVDTSIGPATETGEPRSYVEGGWSA